MERPKALHPRGSQFQGPLPHPRALHSPVWKRDFSTSGGIATTQLKIPATPPAARIRGTLSSLTLRTKQSQTGCEGRADRRRRGRNRPSEKGQGQGCRDLQHTP